MNKRIIHKKCGGFDVCFYAFNQFSGLYFHSSKDTPRSQRSVQLVARIESVNKLIFFEKCGGFYGFFIRLMKLVNYIFCAIRNVTVYLVSDIIILLIV